MTRYISSFIFRHIVSTSPLRVQRIVVTMAAKTGAEELFTNEEQSESYFLYRPKPPGELLDKITSFIGQIITPPFNQVVDVGCGSGQSTSILAAHFNHVLGIDVSDTQIKEAEKREINANVQYKVGSCDSIPLPDTSAELVTSSQAAHWFHLPSFYKEADRVLRPGGVLAIYCYGFPRPHGDAKSEELIEHTRHIYNVDTAGYWHENRKIVDDMYRSIELPYKEQLRDQIMYQDAIWTVAGYAGYVRSWSGYQEVLKQDPEKAKKILESFQDKMLKTLNVSTLPEDTKINVRFKFNLLMARKPI